MKKTELPVVPEYRSAAVNAKVAFTPARLRYRSWIPQAIIKIRSIPIPLTKKALPAFCLLSPM